MEQTQRSRTKSVNAPSQEERRMLKALKKSADEAKQKSAVSGLPHVVGGKKSWLSPNNYFAK